MARSALDLGLERVYLLSPEHSPMTDLGHVHHGGRVQLTWARIHRRSSLRGCRGVVQASKPDLMSRGVAVDLLQMAKRVGPQCEATEYEDLSEKKDLPLDCIVVDD